MFAFKKEGEIEYYTTLTFFPSKNTDDEFLINHSTYAKYKEICEHKYKDSWKVEKRYYAFVTATLVGKV